MHCSYIATFLNATLSQLYFDYGFAKVPTQDESKQSKLSEDFETRNNLDSIYLLRYQRSVKFLNYKKGCSGYSLVTSASLSSLVQMTNSGWLSLALFPVCLATRARRATAARSPNVAAPAQLASPMMRTEFPRSFSVCTLSMLLVWGEPVDLKIWAFQLDFVS